MPYSDTVIGEFDASNGRSPINESEGGIGCHAVDFSRFVSGGKYVTIRLGTLWTTNKKVCERHGQANTSEHQKPSEKIGQVKQLDQMHQHTRVAPCHIYVPVVLNLGRPSECPIDSSSHAMRLCCHPAMTVLLWLQEHGITECST